VDGIAHQQGANFIESERIVSGENGSCCQQQGRDKYDCGSGHGIGQQHDHIIDPGGSYRAAMNVIGNAADQTCGRWLKNRAENSHQPFRRREGAMANFRDTPESQYFPLPPPHASARSSGSSCGSTWPRTAKNLWCPVRHKKFRGKQPAQASNVRRRD
jgi:hypothetical protein